MGYRGRRSNMGLDFLISIYCILCAEWCTYPTAENYHNEAEDTVKKQ